MPKYLHTAQLLRLDEYGNKKKLSKRDMGANMLDYHRLGYAPACVIEYLFTILNSNYEEWHMQNPEKDYQDFPFSIKKMSTSGALFDPVKLNDVSKNMLSKMKAAEVYALAFKWAKDFDAPFYQQLSADPAYAERILNIGRGGKKPRKDYATIPELKAFISFFYDDTFVIEDDYPVQFDKHDIEQTLLLYMNRYQFSDDQTAWFERIKDIAEQLGFASDMKAYKSQPEQYKGSVSDISMFIRVALTGRVNSPDLYEVTQILGQTRSSSRIQNMINRLKEEK